MNRIVIIGVYFGKFPQYINLWLKSCEWNKNIDFLIFTDQELDYKIYNVKIIKIDLDEFSRIASEKLEMNIKLEKPYKCCDFRPAYGKIFEEYIKEYSFWGHCDFDMIFGDIQKFITEDIMNKYDKILNLGHLSLYRNTKNVNGRYEKKGSKVGNFKEVFNNNKSYAFDETNGIYSIYKENNFPVYDKRVFADISMIYKRFRLALNDINYNEQVFFWEKGKVYRVYKENDIIKKEEYIYIHFKKRKNMEVHIKNIDNLNGFYINDKGFFDKDEGLPTIENIKKYNEYNGKIYEMLELLKFNVKRYIKKMYK